MTWLGHIKFPEHLSYLIQHKVSKLNTSSKEEEWLECIAGLRKHKHYIWNNLDNEKPNLFPSNLWTLVHHAAYHGAPTPIIQILIVDKYPLSLPDAEGRQPIDHVGALVSQMYKDLLTPKLKYVILPLEMKLIQSNFHAVIYDRVEALIQNYNLILPVLSVLLEDITKHPKMYFDVPGMHGGFTYWFELDVDKKHIDSLWCRSSSRLVGDSEQLHRCTPDGWSLVKKGSY